MNQPIDRRLVRYWAVAVGVQSMVAILAVCFSRAFGFGWPVEAFADLHAYFLYAKSISGGLVPYRDFLVEYPPLALPFFVAPLLGGESYRVYKLAFVIEMILANALAAWLVAREVERTEGIDQVSGRLAWYTAFFVVLCPMNVTRFDLVPMLAAFAAAVWFARGRTAAGGLMAGVGVLTKLVPGLVIVPVLAAAGPLKPKVKAVVALGLTVGLGVLGWYLLGGNQVVESLRYHSERGLEINSTYASAYMFANKVSGLQIYESYDHSASNVVGRGSALVAKASPFLQVACLLFVAWRSRRSGPADTIRLSAAALLAYMIAGKVLSPQYLVWLIPFVAASGSGSARRVFLGCCVLTTLIFPWNFPGLCGFRFVPVTILLARNLGLVWLFAILSDGRKP